MPKKKRKWIIWVAVGAAVVLLAVWGLQSLTSALRSMQGQRYQTATVDSNVIDTSVVGSGTLTYGDSEKVTIPSGVDVTSVFYESGQTVSKGDLLASVDPSEVELLMSETYQQIADVDDQLKDTSSEPELVTITASTAGTVKTIYAARGSSVVETLSQYRSLLLISPNGRMQAEIQSDQLPAVGGQVTLVLPDGTEKEARVISVREGTFTCELTDKTLNDGLTVEAKTISGTSLGKGQLESVDSAAVIGPAGTVESVEVTAGASVKAGDALLKVRSAAPPAAYQELEQQRRTLAQRYDKLASLYQNGGLVSPLTGVVLTCTLDAGSSGASGSGTANIPSSAQDVMSAFGMGMDRRSPEAKGVKTEHLGLQQGGEELMLTSTFADSEAEPIDTQEEPTPEPPAADSSAPVPTEAPPSQPSAIPTADITQPSSLPTVPSASEPRAIPRLTVPLIPPVPGLTLQHQLDLLPLFRGSVAWNPNDEEAQFSTKYQAIGTLTALDGFYFASDCEVTVLAGNVVRCTVSDGGSKLSFTADYETTMGPASLPSIDWDAIKKLLGVDSIDLNSLLSMIASGLIPSDSLGIDLSGLLGLSGMDISSLIGSGFDMSSLAGLDMSSLAGLDASALAGLDTSALAGLEAAQLQALSGGSSSFDDVTAYTIASGDAMELSIQVSQMDVLSISPEMPCIVTVEALPGEHFEGKVADIASTDNGSGSYTATITLDKSPDMRSGMSASAVITTSETESAMTLPAEALQEDGQRVFVYTSYDESSDTFGGEKDVTTGVSNGTNVEILSGVKPGEIVYYAAEDPMESMMRQMSGGPNGGSGSSDAARITVESETD